MMMTLAAQRNVELTPPTEVGLFNYPECTFTSTGLIIPPGMPFERWEELGRELRMAGKGIQFWIGDWIQYGEHSYGEKYAQAIEVTGKAYQTLRDYVWVASHVDLSLRKDTDLVDFSQHKAVADLPPSEQKRILDKAEREELTFKEVKREVSRVKRAQGCEPGELELIHTPEVQEYLEHYMNTLKELEDEVPITARFLRNMAQAHTAHACWQKNRTLADDCEVIMQAVDEESALSADDLFKWLNDRGYFMSDPELDHRLEYMCSHQMLSETDAGSDAKQENRRGRLPKLYVSWFRKREHLKAVEDGDCM